MTLERAIYMIKVAYENAKEQPHINRPLAHALYMVWKYADKHEKSRKEKENVSN